MYNDAILLNSPDKQMTSYEGGNKWKRHLDLAETNVSERQRQLFEVGEDDDNEDVFLGETSPTKTTSMYLYQRAYGI